MAGIIVQIVLGLAAFHEAAAGASHGLLAIVLFVMAGYAGHRTTHTIQGLGPRRPTRRSELNGLD